MISTKQKECNNAWREKNKEHVAEYARQYRIKNKEKLLEWNNLRREKNKEHFNLLAKNWRKNNPEKVQEAQRRRYLKHRDTLLEKAKQYRLNNIEKVYLSKIKTKFGIVKEDYNELIINQNNSCAICFRKDDYQRIGVDHNHKTGKVRGILCARCNTGIGLLQDDIDLLKEAIRYLEKYAD